MFTGQAAGETGIVYTLGCAEPPAVCTAVDHDPLVYLDETEEDIDWGASVSMRLTGAQRACARLARDAQAARPGPLDLFAQNAAGLTGAAETGPETLAALLGRSRTGADYLACAAKHGVALRPSGQFRGVVYDRAAGTIFYDPHLAEGPLVLAAAAALRQHWQDRQGALICPLAFAPETAIFVGRAQQADVAQAAIRVAWDLHLTGAGSAWAHIEGGSLADLGQAFAAEAFLDFRGLGAGDAAMAVFEAWFLSPRCAAYDRTLIHRMLSVLSRPRRGHLPQGLRLAVPDLLAALGRRPVGENYLARHIGDLLEDPLFTEIRDRANANFLWFVKFEGALALADGEALRHNFRNAAGHPAAPRAQIISLAPRLGSRQGQPPAEGGAQIISLRRAE
ncbi:MAG TPA: hypothetical protein DDX54_02215 [Rhodospirillaceae bacterium]|nr:hypothetical protein [Rhodospirillaceae bacterium]